MPNNNLTMPNFTMNIPIINRNPITSHDISKNNHEKIGYFYFNEKIFKTSGTKSFNANILRIWRGYSPLPFHSSVCLFWLKSAKREILTRLFSYHFNPHCRYTSCNWLMLSIGIFLRVALGVPRIIFFPTDEDWFRACDRCWIVSLPPQCIASPVWSHRLLLSVLQWQEPACS